MMLPKDIRGLQKILATVCHVLVVAGVFCLATPGLAQPVPVPVHEKIGGTPPPRPEIPETHVLEDLESPLVAKIKNHITTDLQYVGQPFQAVLQNTYQYEGKVLPQGSVFKGYVADIAESRRFGRPGFIALQVQEIQFPSGNKIQFELGDEPSNDENKVYDDDASTRKAIIRENAPMTVAGVGASVAATAAGVFALPFALAARMTVGTVQEFRKDENTELSGSQKLGRGLWKGTGIPAAMKFVKRAPDPELHPDDLITLYLGEERMEKLFSADNCCR